MKQLRSFFQAEPAKIAAIIGYFLVLTIYLNTSHLRVPLPEDGTISTLLLESLRIQKVGVYLGQMRDFADGHLLSGDPSTWEAKDHISFTFFSGQATVYLTGVLWLFAGNDTELYFLLLRIVAHVALVCVLLAFLRAITGQLWISFWFSFLTGFWSYQFYRVSDLRALVAFPPINIDNIWMWLSTPFIFGSEGMKTFYSVFPHPMISAPVVLAALYFTFVLFRSGGRFTSVAIMSAVIQYIYLPIAAVYDFFLLTVTIYLFWTRKKDSAVQFLKVGIMSAVALSPLVFVFFTESVEFHSRAYLNDLADHFWRPIGYAERAELFYAHWLLYAIYFGLILLVKFRNRDWKIFTSLLMVSLLVVSLTDLILPSFSVKFIGRGVQPVLGFVLVAAAASSVANSAMLTKIACHKLAVFFQVLLLCCASIFLHWKSNKDILRVSEYYVGSSSKRELFSWLNDETSRDSVVASVDFRVNNLLTAMTHNNAFNPPPSNRTILQRDGRLRFYLTLKLLGTTNEEYGTLVEMGERHDQWVPLHFPAWTDTSSPAEIVAASFWNDGVGLDFAANHGLDEARRSGKAAQAILREFAATDVELLSNYRIDYLALYKPTLEFFSKSSQVLAPNALLYENEHYELYSVAGLLKPSI